MLRYFWVSELKLVVILVIISFWFRLDLWSGLSSVTFGQTINKCLTLHNTCCVNCPSCQSPQVDPAWSLPTLPYLTNTECFVHLLWNMYNSCKYFLLIFSKDKWVFVGSFRFMYIYIDHQSTEKKEGFCKMIFVDDKLIVINTGIYLDSSVLKQMLWHPQSRGTV